MADDDAAPKMGKVKTFICRFSPLRLLCGIADRVGCVEEHRVHLLAVDMLLQGILVILLTVALIGFARDEETMKRTAWTYTENDFFKTYANLWGIVFSLGDRWDSCDQQIHWFRAEGGCCVETTIHVCAAVSWARLSNRLKQAEDEQANGTFVDTANKTFIMPDLMGLDEPAKQCYHAGHACKRIICVMFATACIGFFKRTVAGRWKKEKDVGRKGMLLFASTMPLIMNLATILGYNYHCTQRLNDARLPFDREELDRDFPKQIYDQIEGQRGEYKTGPGFNCLLAAIGCYVCIFLINLVIPATPIPSRGACCPDEAKLNRASEVVDAAMRATSTKSGEPKFV